MFPVLLKLGPLEIKSYGMMLAISFLAGYLLAVRRAESHKVDQGVVLDLSFYILLSAIVGSRIFYVITHWEHYLSNPLAVFQLWEGGLSMMGGVLLALAVSFFYLKSKDIKFTLMGDILVPSIALGVGLTRIGCFFYGCCYGLPTDIACGVHFPTGCAAGNHFHEAIHPTQLYSSAYGFLILLILLAVGRLKPPTGVLLGAFLALYGTARFIVDFFRYYEPEQILLQTPVALTNNQVICIFLFIFGAWLIASSLRAKKEVT